MGTLFSPGKLLLTSEYLVLDGALALAVPTNVGQELNFNEIEDGKSLIFWEAFHQDQAWLKVKINYQSWEIIETNLPNEAAFILKVLREVQRLSLNKFHSNTSYQLRTNLQFPANFGLGSSSTLMNNLANWAVIDAFVLNDNCLGGSGYDIAIAKENKSILFKINKNLAREVEVVDFYPDFKDDLIFVHLNQKQDSREGISLYKSKMKSEVLIDEFSRITQDALATGSLSDFSALMILHEALLSKFLEIPTTKEKFFPDCPVFIKSLGAWGGDFILTSKFSGFENYFKTKGYFTIFEWSDLIN
ncbi:GYDIA family GHMP kinase [Frigoriflavimonas asaccharolytica]|uniref:Mevalonate kinase n=1 Tax=Frigoriflavimonas asaccharolytica TaxID=2735899 RepID=A0A8J8K5D8_9FLAO|nr:GYDIA family GHMP kinase [Frigoriflavimonas asaccharolytica]NRS92700.1 mevalonate kinase [Frigoriflavimonas asaccharolytica]